MQLSIEQVGELREHSRKMVRELGLLQQPHSVLGVTPSQCHALIEIDRHGILSSGELADLLWLDRSTTSRLVCSLIGDGLVEETNGVDRRSKPLKLTPAGVERLAAVNERADSMVVDAFQFLAEEDRAVVEAGIRKYARALSKARSNREFTLRLIQPEDNPAVAKVIRTVMPEFGAVGPGYSIHDPEVGAMYEAYSGDRASLWVVERNGKVVGCGGFAPLVGASPEVCEVKKMYFLPETRGHGVGRRLLMTILDGARSAGFTTVYLETLERMHAARELYESVGFEPRCGPMGATGHHACDSWYSRGL